MDTIDVRTDHHGILLLGGVHDATLMSCNFEPGRSARLALAGVAGERTELAFLGLHGIAVDRLWHGTIIGTISLWRVDAVPESAWSVPDSGWNALLAERPAEIDRRPAEAVRLRERHPDASLCVISCSYGGTWAVLFESLVVSRQR